MTQAQFHEKLELDAIKWSADTDRGERRFESNGIFRMGFEDGMNNRFRFSLDGNRDYRVGLHEGKKKRIRTK